MKKVSLILSIVLFMFLGGCLSKKTAEQLNEVPGNNGGTSTGTTYTFVSEEQTKLSTAIKNQYFSILVPEGTYNMPEPELMVTGSVETRVVKDVLKGIPAIKVKASINVLDLLAEQSAYIKENIQEIDGDIKVIGTGKINLKKELTTADYRSVDVVSKKDGKTYTVITVSLLKKISLLSGSTKDMSYSINTIVEGKSANTLVLFETILRNIELKEQSISSENTDEKLLEAKVNELFVSLRKQSGAENIKMVLNQIYTFVETYYGKKIGITSTMSFDDKQILILKKAKEFSANQDSILELKINEVFDEWEKALETSVAIFNAELDKVRPTYDATKGWVFKYTFAGSSLEKEAISVEKILNSFIDAKRTIRSLEGKADSNGYYNVVLQEMSTSGGSEEKLFSKAVNGLVIAYTLELVFDYDDNNSTANVDRQAEGKYKQWQKLLKWKQAQILKLSTANEIIKGGITGNLAKLYADKLAINDHYLGFDAADISYFNPATIEYKLPATFADMKANFLSVVNTGITTSGQEIIADYRDYFNTQAGRFEDDIKNYTYTKAQMTPTVYGIGYGVESKFSKYMDIVKMFDKTVVPTLQIDTEMKWQEVQVKTKAIGTDSDKGAVTRFEKVIEDYNKLK